MTLCARKWCRDQATHQVRWRMGITRTRRVRVEYPACEHHARDAELALRERAGVSEIEVVARSHITGDNT